MPAIMSLDEPRPRGTVLGERVDRRRVSEAEHFFRCKAFRTCATWDGSKTPRRPVAAPGAGWNSVAQMRRPARERGQKVKTK